MNKLLYKKIIQDISLNNKEVSIIAATKYSNIEQINSAISAGISIIAENRLQDALAKFPHILPVQKHFIGVIQSKKLKNFFETFDVIQSISKFDHLEKLNRIALASNRPARVFLQINISNEEQKSGFIISELLDNIEKLKSFKNVSIEGVMAVAENTKMEKVLRSQFKEAKHVFDVLGKSIPNIEHLSLGMSSDYKIAIEEGSTMIRIGSLLFSKG